MRLPAISPLVAALAAVLLSLIVPPALFLLNVSLHETRPDGSFGEFTLRFYEQLFSGRFFLPSLRNTLIYAFGSAAIAIVVGTVQALIVERTMRRPQARILRRDHLARRAAHSLRGRVAAAARPLRAGR